MRFATVCSGIEAASLAWNPLGWEAVFFSEIAAFPSAVLAHHYPNVPNYGDMTKFQDWPDHAIDLLAGGTPCQAFSVAGLRAGLADPRGNLTLTFLGVVAKYRPQVVVWENVPGVLSVDGGRAFGAFLGGLAELGYGWAYRVLDAQHCRALGLPYAVPQRRRRVFVVGYLGDWRRAAAILFDGASLRGDSPPRREAGQGVAGTLSARTEGGGGLGTDFELGGGLTAIEGEKWPATVAPTLNAHFGDKQGLEDQHALHGAGLFVPVITNALTNNNGQRNEVSDMVNGLIVDQAVPVAPIPFDTTQITHPENRSNPQPGDVAGSLPAAGHPPAASGPDGVGDSDAGAAYTLEARSEVQAVGFGWRVRRLMPIECERLQGMPDGHTDVIYRGKPAADGPRYMALGNSWAVNAARVIGERIALIAGRKS